MKVERIVEIETNDIHVGDQVHVGKYTATCTSATSKAALFLLDQYITGHGYLREALQSDEVLNDFADIRDYMVPFEDGDMLKIPYGCGWDNSEISRFRPIFLISLKKDGEEKQMKVNRVIEVETNDGVLFMEEVFAKYEDTAGNLHWHGTETGEHIIKKQDPLSNFQIPDKCKYCGYYYNFLCRAEQCIKDGVIT